MPLQVDVLDPDNFPLMSLMTASPQEFRGGRPVAPDLRQLSDLSQVLLSLWQAQAAAVPGQQQGQLPAGHYAVRFSPDVLRSLEAGTADFVRVAGKMKAQVRDRATGRLLGVGDLVELAPMLRAAPPGPQVAVGVALATTALMMFQEYTEGVQARLDQLQASLDAVRARLEAGDAAILITASQAARAAQQDLREIGPELEGRREIAGRVQAHLDRCGEVVNKEKLLIAQATQAREGGRKLPLPLPRGKAAGTDEALPAFARLVYGLLVQAQLLSVWEQTGLARGIGPRRQSIAQELAWVREQHRQYRQLWAENPNSVRRYGVDINQHFELLDHMADLQRQLDGMSTPQAGRRTLLLEVGEEGRVSRVAVPSAALSH